METVLNKNMIDLFKEVYDFELNILKDALEFFEYHRGKTAEYLGIKRTTLVMKMKKFGLLETHSIRGRILTDGDIKEMKAEYDAGEYVFDIAKNFGVSVAHVYKVFGGVGYERRKFVKRRQNGREEH